MNKDYELYATQYTIKFILSKYTKEEAVNKLKALLRADQFYIKSNIRVEVYKQERELILYTLKLL